MNDQAINLNIYMAPYVAKIQKPTITETKLTIINVYYSLFFKLFLSVLVHLNAICGFYNL